MTSILIPCFNASPYIEATLDSVLSNIGREDEVILIDDHSEDDSLYRAQRWLQDKGTKHTVVLNTSKGACSSRNLAFTLSSGDFIQWLDADDILGKDKLKQQKLKLAGNPNSIVVSPFVPFIGRSGKRRPHEDRDWSCREVLTGADWLASGRMTIPACWIGPRAVFDRAGPWDESLKINQDGEYFARVLAGAESVIFKPEVNVWYRRGNSGSVSQFTSAKAASLFASVDSIHRTALALEDSPRMRQMVANRYQHAIYTAYPHCPDGIAKAQATLKNLPKPTISNPNAVSPLSKCISSIFGWKTLTHLRLLRNKMSMSARIAIVSPKQPGTNPRMKKARSFDPNMVMCPCLLCIHRRMGRRCRPADFPRTPVGHINTSEDIQPSEPWTYFKTRFRRKWPALGNETGALMPNTESYLKRLEGLAARLGHWTQSGSPTNPPCNGSEKPEAKSCSMLKIFHRAESYWTRVDKGQVMEELESQLLPVVDGMSAASPLIAESLSTTLSRHNT